MSRMKKRAPGLVRWLVIALIVSLLPWTPAELQAAEEEISVQPPLHEAISLYPAPEGLPASNYYSVMVNGKNSYTYQSVNHYPDTYTSGQGDNASWTSFAMEDGPVTIEVTRLTGDPVKKAVVRPLDLGITPVIDGNTVRFTLDNPAKVSVEFDGDLKNKMFIFADPPEDPQLIPNKQDPHVLVYESGSHNLDQDNALTEGKTLYFEPGIHDLGDNKTYSLRSNQTIYVAPGAYVKGSFTGNGQRNISILGRGIISGENKKHDGKWGVDGLLVFRNIHDFHVDGPTLVDTPGFNLANYTGISEDPADLNVYNNIKMIGWRHNSDGIHPIGNSTVRDIFFFGTDDAIDIGQGISYLDVQDVVAWQHKNGSVLLISWNGEYADRVSVNNVDVIHYDTHGGNNGHVILALHGGGNPGDLRNFMIQDVRVEEFNGSSKSFIGLSITKTQFANGKDFGKIEHMYFKDLRIDQPSSGNLISGLPSSEAPDSKVSHLVFDHLVINGKVVTSLNEAGIMTDQTSEDIVFVDRNRAANWSFEEQQDSSVQEWSNAGDENAFSVQEAPGLELKQGEARREVYNPLGAALGSRYAVHQSSENYYVETSQEISGLEDGEYTLSAWVKSSGGQEKAVMSVSGHGRENQVVEIPESNEWTKVSIKNIQVTTGKAEIKFTSQAIGEQWIYFDHIVFGKQYLYQIPSSDSPYKAQAIMGTAAIDGLIDSAWEKAPMIKSDQLRLGNSSNTGFFRMMWDQKYLYILAQVPVNGSLNAESSDLWNRDSVEVFLDHDNSKSPTYDDNDRHIIMDYKNQIQAFDVLGTAGMDSAASLLNNGYVAEVKIPFTDTPRIGDILGMDVQVNSTNGSPSRQSISGWSGTQNQSDQTPSVWGELELIGYESEAIMGTPTISEIIDSEWNEVPAVNIDQLRMGNSITPGTLKAMWDHHHLYLLAEVYGDTALNAVNKNIWENDSVEFFVNPVKSRRLSYGSEDRHIIVNYENSIKNFDQVGLDNIRTVAEAEGTNYKVLAVIPVEAGLQAGDLLGYDSQINSTGGTQNRVSITGWSGTQNLSDASPAVWGTLKLVGFEASAVQGTPNMNAETIDPLWTLAPPVSIERLRLGEIPLPGTFQLLWDDDYLYALVKAKAGYVLNHENQKIWEKDAAEFFVDEDNSKSLSYGSFDRHIIVSYMNDIQPFKNMDLEGVESVTAVTDEGFHVMIKIPFKLPHAAGDRIGFDVQLDSTQGTASRQSITGWSGSENLSSTTPSYLGTVILQSGPPSQSAVQSAQIYSEKRTLVLGEPGQDATKIRIKGWLEDGRAANIAAADLSYTSSDTSVAAVQDDGTVVAKSPGIAYITATIHLQGAAVQTNAILFKVIEYPVMPNRIFNPGFEEDKGYKNPPTGWSVSGDTKAFYTMDNQYGANHRNGIQFGNFYSSDAYKVTVTQTVYNLPDGLYEFEVWHKGYGLNSGYAAVKNYGGDDAKVELTDTTNSYTKLSIKEIKVTSGEATIELYVDGKKGTPMYVDDIVFRQSRPKSTDAALADILIDGSYLPGFESGRTAYEVLLPAGRINIPAVVPVLFDTNAAVKINMPASIPGTAEIVVTAEDPAVSSVYTIFFSQTAAPVTPPVIPAPPSGTEPVVVKPESEIDRDDWVIQVNAGTGRAEVPLHEIKGRSLTINNGSAAMTLDRKWLEEIKAMQRSNDTNAKLEITLQPLDTEKVSMLMKTDFQAAVKKAGAVYQLNVSLINNGKMITLKPGKEAIRVVLPLEGNHVNADLTGVYYFDETSGIWAYMDREPKNDAESLALYLNQFGMHGLFEYSKIFTDVPSTHWVFPAVQLMSSRHIITGVNNLQFKPGASITRAEAAVLISRALKLPPSSANSFSDIKAGIWYEAHAAAVADLGIIIGRQNDHFAPNEPLTREEMAAVLVRAYRYKYQSGHSEASGPTVSGELFQDVSQISDWAFENVAEAISIGLLQGKGNGRFAPKDQVTRAEAAQALYNLLQINNE
ncbi:S-layer homology domain-containing protein [Paenibacillus sp. F411]|uniref:sugar-binding protein n=1 Tax=Paenibacillus sp. F411 TaxID=2820239 RepID=UPI001AAE1A15|nr:sugar-binding protein [Paenibacillus sp. F411]MBO2943392.1 S-layer homology domain-containing protein [Paenibacillus sp. F411]